ncbi:MAG: hypothetical protein ACKO15_16335, partial [Burkholderiales bacterium]
KRFISREFPRVPICNPVGVLSHDIATRKTCLHTTMQTMARPTERRRGLVDCACAQSMPQTPETDAAVSARTFL